MRFDEPTRERYRKALLNKGMAVATLLADVLAGKDKHRELAALPIFVGKPGMRPEEKLRAYLDLIESRRKLLVDGDERFGRCELCDGEVGDTELAEMPWTDRCQTCAAK